MGRRNSGAKWMARNIERKRWKGKEGEERDLKKRKKVEEKGGEGEGTNRTSNGLGREWRKISFY